MLVQWKRWVGRKRERESRDELHKQQLGAKALSLWMEAGVREDGVKVLFLL